MGKEQWEIKWHPYYYILGLRIDAQSEAIEGAAKKLLEKYHPDKGGTGDAEKFKVINEARGVLTDPSRRQRYDTEYKRRQGVGESTTWGSKYHDLHNAYLESCKKLKELEAENSTLLESRKKLKELEAENSTLKLERERVRSLAVKYQRKCNNLEDAYAELLKKLEELESELSSRPPRPSSTLKTLQEENHDLRAALQGAKKLEVEYKKRTEDIKTLQEENRALRAEQQGVEEWKQEKKKNRRERKKRNRAAERARI